MKEKMRFSFPRRHNILGSSLGNVSVLKQSSSLPRGAEPLDVRLSGQRRVPGIISPGRLKTQHGKRKMQKSP